MRMMLAAALLAFTGATASPALAAATITPGTGEGSSTDAFQGATVLANSPLVEGFTAADAFGAVTHAPSSSPYSEARAGGHVIFDGSTSNAFIDFSLGAPTAISGATIYVSSDGAGNGFRGFSGVSLYGFNGDTPVLIDSTPLDPAGGGQTIRFSFAPVVYQVFRFAGIDVSGGARVLEVDGTALPEPASWAMMIGGFGLIGGAMRRRKAGTTLSHA